MKEEVTELGHCFLLSHSLQPRELVLPILFSSSLEGFSSRTAMVTSWRWRLFFLHGVQLCPALGRRGGGVRRRALFSSCCCPLIKLSEQRRSERRGRQHKNSGGAKTLRPPRSIQPVILVQLERVTSASPRSTNSFRHTDMIGTVWTGLRAVYFFA